MNRKLVILYVHIFLETTASLKENFRFLPIYQIVEENKQGHLGLNEASKKTKCIYFHCEKISVFGVFLVRIFSHLD